MGNVENPLVEVLLATYNGGRYVAAQIDSLLAQDYRPLKITVRDDGSADGTRAVVEVFAKAHPERIFLLPEGESTGSAQGNFSLLLQESSAAYVAFADQDDVWLPQKISASMAAMRRLEQTHGAETPLLVFTDLRIVDASLQTLHASLWAHQQVDPSRVHRLQNLLVQNVVSGCTALLNRPLAKLAGPVPAGAAMHDSWVGLLTNLFGHAAFLKDQTVLYRQHGANTLGAVPTTGRRLIPKWRDHAARRDLWERQTSQAEALLQEHGAMMTPAQRDVLEALLQCGTSPSRIDRVANLLRNGFLWKGWRNNLAMLWYLWDKDAAMR